MKHVLVESNWVFQVLEPQHRRVPAATKLLGRAANGELMIHVPHIALKEGIRSIRNKRQRQDNDLKEYRRWAVAQGVISAKHGDVIANFFGRYAQHVTASLRRLEDEASELESRTNVETFALSEAMLDLVLSVKYDAEIGKIRPVDEAILGAVLGRADELRSQSTDAAIYFCTTDSDLRPRAKDGRERESLTRLYDDRAIIVLADFSVPQGLRSST